MTVKKRILLILLALVSFLVFEAFVIHYTIRFQKRWEARNLAAVQGALNFGNYGNYKELEQYLNNGCYASALVMTKFYKEDALRVLGSNLHEANDPSLEKYIRDRDKTILNRPFPSLPLSVTIPPCEGKDGNTFKK